MRTIVKQINSPAFTLIELLVVIAILALLAALLVPGVAAARRKADTATCRSNLRQMATAVNTYSVDHEEWLPPGPNDGTTLYLRRSHRAMYTTDTSVDAAPTQQIAYHTAKYLGLPAPSKSVVFSPMMRCPGAWKLADKDVQTQTNFVNYCVGRGASIGKAPFGTSTTDLPIRLPDAVSRPPVASLGGISIGPSKLWMLTDSDRLNDPGHIPQTDLLPTPAHNEKRNIVYFDAHVDTILVSSLTVDNPPYGL